MISGLMGIDILQGQIVPIFFNHRNKREYQLTLQTLCAPEGHHIKLFPIVPDYPRKNLTKLDRKRYISQAASGSTWSMPVIEEEAMNIFTRPIVGKLQKEMRNSTTYIVEEERVGTYSFVEESKTI